MQKIKDSLFYAGVYAHVVFNQLFAAAEEKLRSLRGK